MRRLHQRGPQSRGLAVDSEGVTLGPDCVLVRRAGPDYRVVSREESAVLQEFLFGNDREPDWLFERCRQIARTLADRQVALAQITGLYIPIGDLNPAQLNRLSLAAPFIKANFNPDEPRVPAGHPEGGEWTEEGATFPTGSDGPAETTVGSRIDPQADRSDAVRRPSHDGQGFENPNGIDPNIIPAAYQGYYHDKVVEDFRSYLTGKGGAVITAVPLTAVDGSTAIADMVVKMPNEMPFVIEVKTGANPQFTEAQRRVYPLAQLGGHVFSTKTTIGQVGLTPGKPLPPLDVWIYWSPGPGLPAKVIKLPPPELMP